MTKISSSELYHALHRLNRQLHRAAHREFHRKGGVYQGQANLLLAVLQNDGASQRDLAEELDVRPSSMTEMLTKLEKNDFILRRQDEKDQRIFHIYLTDKGREAAEKIAEGKDEFAEYFFYALTEEEKEQMFKLTEKLCSSLEEDEGERKGGLFRRHGEHHHIHMHNHDHRIF